MESPNAIWVEYLLQLKKNADEKGFAREKKMIFLLKILISKNISSFILTVEYFT